MSDAPQFTGLETLALHGGQAPDLPPEELPDAQSMVDELERFLREQRGDI